MRLVNNVIGRLKDHFQIRLINSTTDAGAVLEVYKPYILNTSITFEYEVPTIKEFEERIKTITAEFPWLVCRQYDKIVGYAYGSRHRYRTAYNWSAESTIYMRSDFHRKGIGKILYNTLFSLLRLQGYINVYTGVGLPNIKSESFHESMGFEQIGCFTKIGYKMGNWHDVKWYQKHLSEHISDPPTPKLTADLTSDSMFQPIMTKANCDLNV